MHIQVADSLQVGIDNLDDHTLRRFSCQLLNDNGQVTSARVYAESEDEAKRMLNDACYKYANLAPANALVHHSQVKGIY